MGICGHFFEDKGIREQKHLGNASLNGSMHKKNVSVRTVIVVNAVFALCCTDSVQQSA